MRAPFLDMTHHYHHSITYPIRSPAATSKRSPAVGRRHGQRRELQRQPGRAHGAGQLPSGRDGGCLRCCVSVWLNDLHALLPHECCRLVFVRLPIWSIGWPLVCPLNQRANQKYVPNQMIPLDARHAFINQSLSPYTGEGRRLPDGAGPDDGQRALFAGQRLGEDILYRAPATGLGGKGCVMSMWLDSSRVELNCVLHSTRPEQTNRAPSISHLATAAPIHLAPPAGPRADVPGRGLLLQRHHAPDDGAEWAGRCVLGRGSS